MPTSSPSATYQAASPPDQLPQDPKKKNVVVLGSGWGATAFLKAFDNEEYNVVRPFVVACLREREAG